LKKRYFAQNYIKYDLGGTEMKANVGKTDKVIRLILGIAAIILAVVLKTWWIGIVGAIFIVTGLINWCGIYAVCGISTHSKK